MGASEAWAISDDNYTKLLLHFDGTDGSTKFEDSCGNTVTQKGDSKISTQQSKFGGSSGYFDGLDDYLEMSSSNGIFDFGYDDFTIDTWINPTSYAPNIGEIFTLEGISKYFGLIELWLDSGGKLGLCLKYQRYGEGPTPIGSSPVIPLNTFTHIALVRYGYNITLYVNGQATQSAAAGGKFDYATHFSIGSRYQGCQEYFHGYIDEFRFSKGIARWTSNFTPPIYPYADATPNTSIVITFAK